MIRPLATHTALRVGKIRDAQTAGVRRKARMVAGHSGLKVTMPAKSPAIMPSRSKSQGAVGVKRQWSKSDKDRENPGNSSGSSNLPPFSAFITLGWRGFIDVAVCFPRLSIQDPNDPHACFQVSAGLKHQVVRLVMLGNDFNDQVGGNRTGFGRNEVLNPLADKEHQIRSAVRSSVSFTSTS